MRRPSSSRRHWQRDEDASMCNSCAAAFTFSRRRHHCRCCGLIYCDTCCPKGSREEPGRSLSPSPGREDTHGRLCQNCTTLQVDVSSLTVLWDVGSGSFGAVQAGLLPDGRWCAIKRVGVSTTASSSTKEFQKEITVMRHLQHPNLVRYLGSHLEDSDKSSTRYNLLIFLEYVSGGSLSHMVRRMKNGLPLDVARVYTRHMLEGLQYLHHSGIAHRDIKCDNILVCFDTGTAKLGDFGTAWKKDRNVLRGAKATTFVGTPHWMAPEVLASDQSKGYDAMKADIWSVGCTLVEMLTGKPAWNSNLNPMMLMEAMNNMEWPDALDPSVLPTDVCDFLMPCFKKTPSDRPAVSKLLEHQFVCHSHLVTECLGLMSLSDKDAVRGDIPLWTLGNSTTTWAVLLPSGEVVAMKLRSGERYRADQYTGQLKEMALLHEIRHRNVVSFLGSRFDEVTEDGTKVLQLRLYYEFVTGGSLADMLAKMPDKRLPPSVVRVYTMQLLQGLEYLHRRKVAHRNISCKHILVSCSTGLVKLSNFSEATDPYTRHEKSLTFAGCPETIAPEVITTEEGYDPFKADIWSLGCVVVEMFTGKPAWESYRSVLTLLHAISKSDGWPECVSRTALPPTLQAFLGLCFQRNPARRSDASILLQHPYFTTPT